MENKKVVIENRINSRVIFIVPELRFSRVWEKKGVKKYVDLDTLREGLYRTGNEFLFKNDILYIADKEVRVELGLDDPDNTENQHIDLDEKQIRRYLTVAPARELRELMPKLTVGQKQAIVDYAIENELTAIDKCEIIKEFTKKDVIKTVQLKRQAEEK